MSNGLTLVGQQMPHVSSAAMAMLVPCGASHDGEGQEGSAAVFSEWCLRGAGPRDSRQLQDALDALGCQHGQTVLSEHVQFSAAQLGRNLHAVLGLCADLFRRPRFEDGTFDSCRELAVQDLRSLEDEPARKCNVLLRERFYPHPLGRCSYGREESLTGLAADGVRRQALRGFTPAGTILGVAGRIDWDAFCAAARECFDDWQGPPLPLIEPRPAAGGATFVLKDSAQMHIALAHRSVVPSHGEYYAARLAESVLSGGMSSRLFVEVREKRGLSYHASARYHSLKGHAGLFTYVGTPPEHAQETLEVTVRELRRLAEGIEEEEIRRSRTQLKSSLVMQGESTGARAGALVSDWYHLKRLRSLEELTQAVEGVTIPEVLEHLRHCPAKEFTALAIGPRELDFGVLSAT